MAVSEHRASAPRVLGYGVLTASDSRSPAGDTSGDRIQALVEEAGHRVVARGLEVDDPDLLRRAVLALLDRSEVDVVVVTGGTGFGPRDVTVEAVSPLFERPVAGFGELFRMLSHRQVGAAAMLSRATAGVVGGQVVFLLPGSPKAVELAMTELILPEAAHLIGVLRRAPPRG